MHRKKQEKTGEEKLERLLNRECNPREYSPLTLAFIGDGVYELFVREHLVCRGNCPAKKLHAQSVEAVRCEFQAKAVEKLMPLLSGEETDIVRRGRNAHTTHTPKNAEPGDYHAATGFEALFGYLYLQGDIARLRQFFDVIFEEAPRQENIPG